MNGWLDAISEAQRALYTGATRSLNALQESGLDVLLSMASAAFAFGMLHALLPGHGKAVLSSYHAAEGNWRSALGSSLLLILTHVGSAIAIVLSGYAILTQTLGGAGRAPVLEAASQVLIISIGLWLFWRAFHPHRHHHPSSAPLLAVAAGIVPCPLTTFIMTYAVVHGAIKWGVLLSAVFAAGMILTVALFPLAVVLARTWVMPSISKTEAIRGRIEVGLEAAAALALIALGAWPLLLR